MPAVSRHYRLDAATLALLAALQEDLGMDATTVIKHAVRELARRRKVTADRGTAD